MTPNNGIVAMLERIEKEQEIEAKKAAIHRLRQHDAKMFKYFYSWALPLLVGVIAWLLIIIV